MYVNLTSTLKIGATRSALISGLPCGSLLQTCSSADYNVALLYASYMSGNWPFVPPNQWFVLVTKLQAQLHSVPQCCITIDLLHVRELAFRATKPVVCTGDKVAGAAALCAYRCPL